MRRSCPLPGAKRWSPIAWRCLCALVLSLTCAVLSVPPARADTAPQTELEQWAADYPFQYGEWAASAHGVAFLKGDANAPGCTDCHDDPATGQVYTSAYRLEIPSRCSTCHADPQKMKGTDLATDVYDTYRADVHGRAIEYYHKTDPGAERFEAVCSDCHGSHTAFITPASEMTERCQSCHSTASEGFGTAATGHVRAGRRPVLVSIVRLFYLILIPAVLGVMLLYIALDIWHRARSRRQGRTA